MFHPGISRCDIKWTPTQWSMKTFMILWNPAALHPFLKQRLEVWGSSAEDDGDPPAALQAAGRGRGCPHRARPSTATLGGVGAGRTGPPSSAKASASWRVLSSRVSTRKREAQPSPFGSGHKWNQWSVCPSAFPDGIKNKRDEERHKEGAPYLFLSSNLFLHLQWKSLMAARQWFRWRAGSERHRYGSVQTGIVSTYWNSLKCWAPTVHLAPARQLHPTDATYPCDRQLHAPSRG